MSIAVPCSQRPRGDTMKATRPAMSSGRPKRVMFNSLRTITRVVLPTAGPGLITGSLLAIARGAGETAPLLFTIGAGHVATGNLGQPMNSLPIQIFNDLGQTPTYWNRAWGAALALVALILLLNLFARAVSRRSRMA